MKGITYCGACADYDVKKHCCKRGAKLESNPQDKFFDDCPLPDAEPVLQLHIRLREKAALPAWEELHRKEGKNEKQETEFNIIALSLYSIY